MRLHIIYTFFTPVSSPQIANVNKMFTHSRNAAGDLRKNNAPAAFTAGAFFFDGIAVDLRVRSVDRANACAGAAFNAKLGVDAILSVFVDGNSADGAFCFAGAAADAFVFVDAVCHM